MKSVSGTLRIDLAQYRDLEAFASFGSDLDAASKAQLARGERMYELLKQPQYTPYPIERQIVSIWAGTTGKLDDVPVEDVQRFESELLDHVAHSGTDALEKLRSSGRLDDELTSELEGLVDEFKAGFTTSEGKEPGRRADRGGDGLRRGRPGQGHPLRAAARGVLSRGCQAPRLPPAPYLGAVDAEDHQGDGAHRRLPDRQGAGPGAGQPAVRRRDHPRPHRPGEHLEPGAPAAPGAPESQARRHPRGHQRPRPGRWLQLERHQGCRGTPVAVA